MAMTDELERIKEKYDLDDREIQDFALQFVYNEGHEDALAEFIEDEIGCVEPED